MPISDKFGFSTWKYLVGFVNADDRPDTDEDGLSVPFVADACIASLICGRW